MSVNLSELKPGMVAIDQGGSICVITEMRPDRPVWPVVYVRQKASGTAYKGRPESFKAIVGQVDLAAFQAVLEAATKATLSAEPVFGCPENLKGLKIGDVVMIRHGSSVVQAVYEGYHYNRPKYPISYAYNGRHWKGVTGAVQNKVS